ncbi:MAG: MBOAT family O-acyltransferase [bacterium]|nr:MBOAT family O-acyltransferase [bacterium]
MLVLNQLQLYKIRNTALLIISYGFYANLHYYYPILLLFVTLIAYTGGAMLHKNENNDTARQWITGITVSVALLPLAVLKYAPAYTDNLWLPVGLSFFTFQALTYTLDVHRRKITEKFTFLDVALFTAFFPTLLSGPIERARNLIPQLRQRFPMTWENTVIGAQYFVWGLFKKIVIADRIAEWVTPIYANGTAESGSTLAITAVLYSIQIYCDFSGYASMALGCGRMLGIRLTDNFNFPYFATTIKDFWRRWHISLTSWFTEYVYISLGGNKVPKYRWVINISAVFLLSGIWHGATWSFVIWGGIHGVLYLIEHFTGVKDKLCIYPIFVFIGVTLTWVFFRVPDASLACSMIAKMFTGPWLPFGIIAQMSQEVLAMCLLCLIFIGIEVALYKQWYIKHWLFKAFCFSCLITLTALFAISSDKFVYFQF